MYTDVTIWIVTGKQIMERGLHGFPSQPVALPDDLR